MSCTYTGASLYSEGVESIMTHIFEFVRVESIMTHIFEFVRLSELGRGSGAGMCPRAASEARFA